MKPLKTSTLRIKPSVVSRNRRYYWLLLPLVLVTASLLGSGAVSASCNFLSILASLGSGDGQVITPRAIAIDPSDNVFVADQNDRVQKFSASGVFQFKFATGGSSAGSVVAPSGVAVDRTTGDIYVTDGFPERTSEIRLYDLRHSCATLLLAAGEHAKVVSERLGHASITLTLDTYSHVLPTMQQSATERLEKMLYR